MKSARRKARRLALQALYQWQLTAMPVQEVVNQHLPEANPKKVDVEYFKEIVVGVVKNFTQIDDAMLPFLDRELKDLNPVELAIMRIAIFELIYKLEIPYKVIINEALVVAKAFGALEGYKYINGVLDKVARKTRVEEINADKRI